MRSLLEMSILGGQPFWITITEHLMVFVIYTALAWKAAKMLKFSKTDISCAINYGVLMAGSSIISVLFLPMAFAPVLLLLSFLLGVLYFKFMYKVQMLEAVKANFIIVIILLAVNVLLGMMIYHL